MSFFLQLKLLLWKNFKARKRQKFRCFSELTWPLCLFLLLIWVRSKGFIISVHPCNFEEKPLPSAGLLFCYQGLICTLNNTCHGDYMDTVRNYSNLNSSRFLKFMTDVVSVNTKSDPWNKNVFKEYSKDIDELRHGILIFSDLQKKNSQTTNKTDINQLYHDNITKSINNSTMQLMDVQNRIHEKLQYLEKILELLKVIERIDKDYAKFSRILSESPIVDDIFFELHSFLCGSFSESMNLSSFWKRKRSYESFEKYLKNDGELPTLITPKYEYDPSYSRACNKLYEKLETSKVFNLLWKMIKPFAKGKVIFSPNTTAVVRIIERMKENMMPQFPEHNILLYLPKIDLRLYNKAGENIKFLKNFIDNYKNDDELKEMVDGTLKETILKSINLQNQFRKSYEKIEQLKEDTFQENRISVAEMLKCYSSIQFEGYQTEKEAERRSYYLCENDELLVQISFLNMNGTDLNPLTEYKLRMNSNRLPRSEDINSYSSKIGANFDPIEDLPFITYGFVYIQDMIEKSIITELAGRNDTPGFILKQFPYPCHTEDWFMPSLAHMFPLFMVLSWVYTSSMTIKSIVHEKEEKLKEIMHVLGLNNAVHWSSWFIDSFIPMSITAFFLSILLVKGRILANADMTLVMSFLLFYTFAIISQCFLLSVFFSKANVAATCGGIIFFVTYLPFPFIEYWDYYLSGTTKMFACLSSNVALGIGSKILAIQELKGVGATWENWTLGPLLEKRITLAFIMFILLIDSALYFLVALYIERVFPGNIGLPKPWYFPFVRNYWIRRRDKLRDYKAEEQEVAYTNEPEPADLRKGVEIINLSKTYSNGKQAISNLNVNFYENQITAFLGRNGAGKTTTISILMGLFPPSDGTALIYGHDIRHQMSTIRRSLGVCPQHNILFQNFTVEEHLWFFGRLKGHDPGKVQVEIQQILTDLNLFEKKNSLPIYLSGGLKRKLSIAIAFIGGSRTVILDEPTAGVDPYSRIGIWNLLQKHRKGRTIIMTTHIMSEAELLGDRIAIFTNGHLLCYGSPTFLKSQFGSGYVLTIDYKSENQNEDFEDQKIGDITKEVKNYVPMAEVSEKLGTEIKYILPKVGSSVHKYQKLFQYLEENRNNLGINSFGVSDTTLEEVFLKVVDEDDNEGEKLQDIKEFEGEDKEFIKSEAVLEKKRADYFRHFRALHTKRVRHSKRNIIALGLQLLLPVFFVCLCMWITYKLPPVEQPRAIYADHSICPECLAGFMNVENTSGNWTNKYIKELLKPAGFGSKCVWKNETKLPHSCKEPGYRNGSQILKDVEECYCSNQGSYICPPCRDYPKLDGMIVSTGKEMVNITGKNTSQWIIDTWHCFERIRRGGYTFGIEIPKNELNLLKKKDQHFVNGTKDEHDNYSRNDNIKIWFDSRWKISPVVYLNNINNVILRASLPTNVSNYYGIKLYIHPMNYTRKQYDYEYRYKAASALLHSIALIFALSFIPASFVIYLIEERISNSKHLQFMSGVNWVLYWVEALTWDMACYILSIILCILSLMIFKAEAYTNPKSLPGLTLLLILYGWAVIPLMYPASFIFDVPSSAFVSLACLNIVLGVTTTASTYVLKVFNDEYLTEIERILRNVFVLFPHFCLGEGILKIAEMHVVITTLSSVYGIQLETDLLSVDFLGKNFLSLFAAGILFFSLVLLIEKSHYHRFFSEMTVTLDPPLLDDDDVIAERNRVLNSEINDVLVLKCLTKIYTANKQVAVNQICLGVKKGECFGLLGLNGAGKTTTFKMLTGDITITFGDALILGHSIRNKLHCVKSLIGYCPQFDALHSRLTPEEHLEFYSHLRNIPPSEVNELVQASLKKFDLLKFKNVCTQYLSGGNKRKLSTAIAMLGNTRLVFLDEPTSGMDPKGRRFLWSRIKNCVASGRAVVLTSHSISECESLCSRVTIMADGQFRCLGSTQHLKNKYGQGYNLAVRAPIQNMEEVKKRILMMFPIATEISTHGCQTKFEVNVDTVSLSKAFNLLEAMILTSLIEDYSISQKSLEEIFLHFVRLQNAEKTTFRRDP
nr:retinal-specific ATP-binding cassette transporter-like [Halyomorpha halys]